VRDLLRKLVNVALLELSEAVAVIFWAFVYITGRIITALEGHPVGATVWEITKSEVFG
jgi:hypothetical protein